MRLTSIGLIAAATIGTTGIALSADMPVKAPAYAPPQAAPYNWTGSYIGGNFGYAWGSDPINLTPGTAFPGTVPLSLADNPRGVFGWHSVWYQLAIQPVRAWVGFGFLLQ